MAIKEYAIKRAVFDENQDRGNPFGKSWRNYFEDEYSRTIFSEEAYMHRTCSSCNTYFNTGVNIFIILA